jgi:hypothetical protein
MEWIFAFLQFYMFFIVTAGLVNLPLMLLAVLFRRRVNSRLIQAALAFGFAAWTGYLTWRMEWFDVWRHGIPPVSYIIKLYVPYMAALGLLGWFLGGLITRPPQRELATD